jgi:LEA14-like dessication related protein
MRKNIFSITAIIITVAVIACKTVNPSFQEPVISFHSVTAADGNINNIQLLCKIQVKNTNSFEIPFPQTGWELFIKDISYKAGTAISDGKIKAKSAVFMEVPIKVEYTDFFKTYKSLIGSKQASYKIALAVKYSYPDWGEKVWNFDNSGELPLLQLPLISVPAMVMDNAEYSKTEILVTVNVENPNVFEIPSPKFSYDYQISKKSFIWGIAENEAPLAPNSVTPIQFRLIVNYADFYRSFSNVKYTREAGSLLVLLCDYRIPVFSGESRRFDSPGAVPIRR